MVLIGVVLGKCLFYLVLEMVCVKFFFFVYCSFFLDEEIICIILVINYKYCFFNCFFKISEEYIFFRINVLGSDVKIWV